MTTDSPHTTPITHQLQHLYPVAPEAIWELWTTAGGIEAWWAPAGFVTRVTAIDLRVGAELVYEMEATDPGQIAFMERMGMPLVTESRKTFTQVVAPRRLAYDSLVDFVPGVDPYRVSTTVELEPAGGGTQVTMTAEPMHDAVWTERLLAGRQMELDKLAALVG